MSNGRVITRPIVGILIVRHQLKCNQEGVSSTVKMTNLDHFSGGVPAKVIFEMNVQELSKIIELCSTNESTKEKALEVCFIGLISYFEAFMKDHFASIINICPELLNDLKKNGQDTTINSADLLILEHNHINKVGFLVAEKYDLGTANKINSVYMALLKVSPFSKSEKQKFDNLLNDRNLIVHHGGIYSLSYSQQNHHQEDVTNNAFMHSLVIDNNYFDEALKSINKLVVKTVLATHKKLSEYINENKINLTDEKQNAFDALVW
jgi:hypothetical protein